VPHKQHALLLPQPAERKQQLECCCCTDDQSACQVHTVDAQSAGGTSVSALAPFLDLLPAARQSSTSCPRGICSPSSAAGSSDGIGRTHGTDLDAVSLCDGTFSLKMHKTVRACLDNQSSMQQESMLRLLHMDVKHHLRIAKERKKNADGAVSAAKNDPRKIPHHNIYMYIHVLLHFRAAKLCCDTTT